MANTAPDGTDNTISVDPLFGYTFDPADFGFTDPDGGQFTSIRFDTVPQNGQILVNGDTIVEAGDVFIWADISSLTYSPGLGASGPGFASFTFSVSDGTDFDPVPNTITFDASSPPNSAPTFSETLGGTVNFTEGGAPVVLDDAVSIFDAELAASGAYEGAVLTLQRATGANPDDVFGSAQFEEQSAGTGNVKFFDSVDLNTVGSYTLVGGVLTIVFFSNATQAAVDAVLSSLTYANTSDTPPESVDIDWTFFDANDAGAPAGLSATGTTTVSIEAVNDAPIVTLDDASTIPELIAEPGRFVALLVPDDPDGDTVSIAIQDAETSPFQVVLDDGAWLLQVRDASLLDYESGDTVDVILLVDDGSGPIPQQITVSLADVNEAPQFARLGDGEPVTFVENAPEWTILDTNAAVIEPEFIAAAANGTGYSGSPSLVVTRSDASGANPGSSTDDRLAVLNELLSANGLRIDNGGDDEHDYFASSQTILDDTFDNVVATITGQNTGQLQIQFDPWVFEEDPGFIDIVLRSIGYRNISDAPPDTVTIGYTFDDDGFDNFETGPLQVTGSVVVAITPVDDAATGVVTVSGLAEEGGMLTADTSGISDVDGAPTFTYQWQMFDSDANDWVPISGETGPSLSIASDQSMVGTQVRVSVTSTDPSGGTTTFDSAGQTIANVNDDPIDIVLSASSVAELATNDTLVGLLSSSDADSSGNETFTLLDSAGGRFKIVGNELRVADGLLLDFEQGTSHTLRILVEDGDGGSFERSVAITVSDITPEQIRGDGRDNVFVAGSGNDTLNGDVGADSLTGGSGDDFYVVDNAGDRVFESLGGGNDRLASFVTYTLGAGQEIELFTPGSFSSTTDINLTGNEFSQSIIGNAGNNVILGLDGDDTLNGGAGADTLTGGGGNDFYVVDNAGDRAFENVDGGNDRLASYVSYALGAGQEIELLTPGWYASTTDISLTGNEFAQTIIGNDGNNVINGLGGADTMNGLGGNDFYVVDNAGDRVFESIGGGADRVASFVSYTLRAGQEIELLTPGSYVSTTSISLTGNEFAQTIIGNAGDNRLDGRLGSDTMTGGLGADTFVFSTDIAGGSNVDRIADFVVTDDTIELSRLIFNTLPVGTLNPDAFWIGAAAHDPDDRIIYNASTGALLYDADGTGSASAIQFARLSPGLALTAGDFIVA